jgi:hypothetical protein
MQRLRSTLVATAIVLSGPGIAACTNPAPDSGVATAVSPGTAGALPAAPPSMTGDRQKWLTCLEEQGVKIVDGKPDFLTVPKSRQEQAAQACAHLDPDDDTPLPPLTVAEMEQWRKWAQCMRDKGIDMGDPDPNVAGGRPLPRSTLFGMDDLMRADRECESLAVPTQGLGR